MKFYIEILSSICILAGAVFMFSSALAIIKFQDFYIRNSTSTKATTLGIGLVLLGIIIHFNDIEVLLEVIAITFLIFLISPMAAHVTARAALRNKVPFSKVTQLEQFQKHYDQPENIKKKE